jgi:hypothetical protein
MHGPLFSCRRYARALSGAGSSLVSSKENLAGLFGRGWLALTSKTQLSPSTRIPCPSAGDQTPHGALLPFHDRRTDTNVRWNRERKKDGHHYYTAAERPRGMDRPSLISSLQPEKRALCLLRRDHRRPEYRPRSCLPIRSEIPSFHSHRHQQPCVRAGAS